MDDRADADRADHPRAMIAHHPLLRRVAPAVWLLLAAALAFEVGYTIVDPASDALDTFVYKGLYLGIMFVSATICLARAVLVREDRTPWAVLGAGLAVWAASDLYWTLMYAEAAEPPYPSLADWGWLSFYPACYTTVILLLRRRVAVFHRALWLDGLIAALSLSAVVAALVLRPIIAASMEGTSAAVIVSLAYPAGDLLLIALLVAAFAITGWRPDRTWLWLGAGLALGAIADMGYLWALAHDTWAMGSWYGPLWPAATMAVAAAAWQSRPPVRAVRLDGMRLLAIPTVGAVAAIVVLFADHFVETTIIALSLAAATLFVVVARMLLAFRDHMALLERTREESLSDALTGLGNRRRLHIDLEAQAAEASAGSPLLLLIFDLNGFKAYNDAFGHPAGDALLARLGSALAATAASWGHAYRMGGDEFCVLARPGDHSPEAVAAACADALSEQGEGFSITAACGASAIDTPDAGPRRSARPTSGCTRTGHGAGVGEQPEHSGPAAGMAERNTELGDHLDGVTGCASASARPSACRRTSCARSSRPRRCTTSARRPSPTPSSSKPGPLDTRSGPSCAAHAHRERIMLAAPALADAASLVRASHEHYDGGGYPTRSRARRSRSGRGSSRSATRTTR
jgi:diguanylate cyclase (GGDEF)-like protein